MTRKKKITQNNDPHAEREARKYEHPIPSREHILTFLEKCKGPQSQRKIAAALHIEREEELEGLRRRLNAMERDGQVVRNRRGGYGALDKMDLIRGRVIAHPDGFGFLVPETGGDDVFLSAREMRSLLHGDRAVVRISGVDRRGRKEGSLVEVLERANQHVVGRFVRDGVVGYVIPDNKRLHQDILIPAGDENGAEDGQIVVAEIVQQPDRRHQPVGRIDEVLGEHMAPGMEIDIAIRAHDLPCQWPDSVVQEAERFGPEVADKDKRKRLDLRELPLVTIDGEDARDFDDAVYCERKGKGWRLLVAIADVSHYVKADSALDREATLRGNSVYFPERVLPMLPEALSNGLCSLNPEVDRLCMVCELDIGPRGKVNGHRFHEAVMRSAARLTYDQVNALVVEKDAALRRKHKALLPHLDDLYQLYQLFARRRQQRGAIEFESTETRIVFAENRKIERIVATERNDAHRLIEEFMVAANVAAAQFLLQHKIPALYRVHEPPSAEKLDDVRAFLGELGLQLGGGEKPDPGDYARLLAACQGREDAHLIQTVLLRSMRLAVYSPVNIGHFGLAFDAYTHFTSPIRRYPDLLVHRAIRHLLRGKPVSRFPYSGERMAELGEHCSMTDRRADEATRDAISWLKCEYMMDKVGEEFEGVISAVTSFGLFVELKGIYVEGLVHITELKRDYYHYDPTGHRLKGERTGQVFRLGNPVKVKVMRVDLDEKKIDFNLV